jgi:hypothetical protein
MSEYLQGLPAGTKVVMTEHGYVGANNLHITIIDVIGLHSPYIAHHGFSVDWLFAQKPDAIWVPHWNYTCLNHKIFSHPGFWDEYVLYPLLFNWGIALRKDSPHYTEMLELLTKKVHEMYPGVRMDDLTAGADSLDHDTKRTHSAWRYPGYPAGFCPVAASGRCPGRGRRTLSLLINQRYFCSAAENDCGAAYFYIDCCRRGATARTSTDAPRLADYPGFLYIHGCDRRRYRYFLHPSFQAGRRFSFIHVPGCTGTI